MSKRYILEVATKEFSSYGYDGVSMNKLADKLDLNKATIYYHFKDKQTLYQEILTKLIQHRMQDMEHIIKSDLPAQEKFQQYIKILILNHKEHPESIAIALREMANLGSNIQESFIKEIEKDMVYLKQILQELDLKDHYQEIDFYAIKAMITGTICTYFSMQMSDLKLQDMKKFNKNHTQTLDHIGDIVSSILLDALCKNNKGN